MVTDPLPSTGQLAGPRVAFRPGALALFVAVLSCGCHATDAEPPITGPVLEVEGARYEWMLDWPAYPDGFELGNTHGGIVVASDGRILFNTDREHAVVVVGPNGDVVDEWGSELAGGLHGMALASEPDDAGAWREILYLVHTGRSELIKATLDGEILWRRGWPEESGLYENANQFNPTAIDVAPDGTIYVADGYGFQWVHLFAPDGRYLESFGGPGTDDGQFRTCHGLAIDASGEEPELWVADRENGRLQVFGLGVQHLRTVRDHFRRPCSVVRGPDGQRVVADLAGRITLLHENGSLIGHLGDQPDEAKRANNGVPPEEWIDGEFVAPHFATFDEEGNLYVLDWVSAGRVTKLRRL
jgi:hypothetical protein